MPIDTHLDATPADITSSALDVGKVKTAVDEAEIDVSRANRTMQSGELEGETAKQVKKSYGVEAAAVPDLVLEPGELQDRLGELCLGADNG